MKLSITFVFLLFIHFLAAAQNLNAGETPAVNGIVGSALTAKKQYVTAGDRAYIIGTQNGVFPDMGEHIPNGMGGIWAPPYKLADGFWAEIRDNNTGKSVSLFNADNFTGLPYGNLFRYKGPLPGISVDRLQFCPDGLPGAIIRYTFYNSTNKTRKIMLTFTVKSNLRPVWFTDTLNREYPDVFLSNKNDSFIAVKDAAQPYYLALKSTAAPMAQTLNKKHLMADVAAGSGVYDDLYYEIIIKPHGNSKIAFAMAGTQAGLKSSLAICKTMLATYPKLLGSKVSRMNGINAMSAINIPDKQLQTVYEWIKINTEWLKRTIPGLGTGLTAGYMEYPWWFGCDNTYALQGSLATGNFELARQTLDLLYRKSKEVNDNGRIVHEITAAGKVVNKGNTQETAHFIMCANTYLKWTGDKAFVQHLYPYMKQGITWLIETMDTNHDLFPEGYGITEISGLNAELIDVSVYTQQALSAMAGMAAIFEDKGTAERYSSAALKLQAKINRDFYDSGARSYSDFFGTRQQALQALAGSLKQLKSERQTIGNEDYIRQEDYYKKLTEKISSLPDSSRGWLTNKNWVINTPMETGIAPRDTAIAALDQIRRYNCGKYGPYLSAVETRKMMTIATGVQAVAECRYGRIDSAMWYMHRICATFGMVLPGSISEMMPGYGCFTQEWTNYGIQVPLIGYIFGVSPDAVNKSVSLHPVMPAGWNYMTLKNLHAGENVISMQVTRLGTGIICKIRQNHPLWTLNLQTQGFKRYSIDGKIMPVTVRSIQLTGEMNQVTLER